MAAISEDTIRGLAAFDGGPTPVTSLYLDIDGRRHPGDHDHEQVLDQLLRDARGKANGTASVSEDLRRIEEYVKGGLDRSVTRGLAIFSCSDRSLWEVLHLPVPVDSRVVFGPSPAVRPLEAVVQEYERFCVLLVDRRTARVFVFELGELVDRSEVIDELPRDIDRRGHSERGDTQHHNEALAHEHLRHAAAAAFEVFKSHPFEHLAIGAADDLAAELESVLHPYLRERLTDRIAVRVDARLDEIRAAALRTEHEVERRREARHVGRLRDALGAATKAAAGLDAVLDALAERRVDHLLVSAGYSEMGWRCGGCGRLAVVGRSCPACATPMAELDDVVEEAVDEALRQHCRIDVCVDNADLDVLGRIGALLRY